MTWTIVEPGAYLIAACLPTLRPLVVWFWAGARRQALSGAVHESTETRGGSRSSTMMLASLGGCRAVAGGGGVGDVSLESHFGRDADYFELVEKGE